MRGDFVNEVARIFSIERKDLIEKDFILHQILLDLSKSKFFSENFSFKGGTCLIKCYLGYFRFSEDIDFTWKDQEIFKGMSQKEIRRNLSSVINEVGGIFETIAEKRWWDFRCVKSNPDYVELGGGNKTATLKVWYDSEILKRRSFFKVQINFVEKIRFPIFKRELSSLVGKGVKELQILFPEEYKEYSKRIMFDVYDVREILCEKVGSILTRRGVKARDFVDVYLISRKFGINPGDLKVETVDKILFMLTLYKRYKRNFREKKRLLESENIFSWGGEKDLILVDINEKDFYRFLDDFTGFLNVVVREVEARK
jgi:predicted nucleotidyltransferase component of viral defense system